MILGENLHIGKGIDIYVDASFGIAQSYKPFFISLWRYYSQALKNQRQQRLKGGLNYVISQKLFLANRSYPKQAT
jgi:hypothetical protein